MTDAVPPGAPIRAAGGVVLRASASGGWEVVVIHRPEQDDWTLPKGKVEPGETTPACALREVREETSLECTLGRFVGEVRYLDRKQRPKVVEYWVMQAHGGDLHPSAEIDDLRWVTLAEAVQLLTYPHDRELVASAARSSPHRSGP